jgi:hypothetical protein
MRATNAEINDTIERTRKVLGDNREVISRVDALLRVNPDVAVIPASRHSRVNGQFGDGTVARGHQRDTSTVDVQVTIALAAIGRRRRD